MPCMIYVTRDVGNKAEDTGGELQSPAQTGMAKSREGFLLEFRLSPCSLLCPMVSPSTQGFSIKSAE